MTPIDNLETHLYNSMDEWQPPKDVWLTRLLLMELYYMYQQEGYYL